LKIVFHQRSKPTKFRVSDRRRSAIQWQSPYVRVGYVVSVDLTPVAWSSFIDTHKANSSTAARLMAAFKSMLSVRKLVRETNTLENLCFPTS
jgi:hypothetical protein